MFAHEDGEEPALTGALRGIFLLLANQLDRDRVRYEEMCARNRSNALKGVRASAGGEAPDEPAMSEAGQEQAASGDAEPQYAAAGQAKRPQAAASRRSPVGPDKDTDTDKDTDIKKSVYVCDTHTFFRLL